MQVINLNQDPNSSYTFEIDNDVFELTLRTTRYGVIYDLTINYKEVLRSVVALPLTPLIIYDHLLPDGFGNLMFSADPDKPLNFKQFNITQFLIILSKYEMESYNNAIR